MKNVLLVSLLTLLCCCNATKNNHGGGTKKFVSKTGWKPKNSQGWFFDRKETNDFYADLSNQKTLDNSQFLDVNSLKEKELLLKTIELPTDYTDSQFLNDVTGHGSEIDNLMGAVFYRKDSSNRYAATGFNIRLSSSNVKIRTEKNPIKFDRVFDSSYSTALNALVANISHSKKNAYSLQLLKLGDVSINDDQIDLPKLKSLSMPLSDEYKKNLYVVMGVTNYYLRASQFSESGTTGEAMYAINIGGKRFLKTSSFSETYKIAVTFVPLDLFIQHANRQDTLNPAQ
ncbi:MAG: hypothetical protein ACN6OJ_09625 [Chryseobacterium sp.]|uniref:hypothetical protein n=1 Tax=Chryseobacterium sp. TaxID=1871047 RepID=UPI003D14759F